MTTPVLTGKDLQVPRKMAEAIPARVALHYNVLAVGHEDGLLKIAVPEDLGRQVREELRVVLNQDLIFVTAEREEIRRAVARLYGVGAGTVDRLTEDRKEETLAVEGESLDGADERSATIARLVNELLRDAMTRRASDIHVEPFEQNFRIRYRVDGVLQEAHLPDQIRGLAPAIISRIKIMAQLDIGEKRLPQDGRIKVLTGGEPLDLRVSVLPSSHGEAIVIRILKPLELLALEDLGFEGAAIQQLRELMRRPHGMILVTGPTGSGKTTTLYAALKELNTMERKILTIEDPVEYKLPGVIQMQVHTKIGFTFAQALRSMLRHDPDCLMIGEIRDTETAEMSIRAALTGHLVFSTLHTNDAPSAVTRLIEMGIEPHLIASSLTAVIAQRLVRLLCPPCERCGGTGFFGRTVIYELMKVDEPLRMAIAERRPSSELKRLALGAGMIELAESGRSRAAAGLTISEEVERATLI